MAGRNTNKKVTLPGKRCPAHGVGVTAVIPMVFGSTLTLPTFGFVFFFRLRLGVKFGVSVVRLGLG